MSLTASLFLLLLGAHVLGRLSALVALPPLAGHMIAGVLIGPSVLGWVEPSEQLNAVSDLAVLIVVLTAGLEMRMQHVLEVFRGKGVVALLVGLVPPLLIGMSIARAFSIELMASIVIALCIAVTALPLALQILRGFGMLGTRVARIAVSGALLSDIVVFLILGGVIGLDAQSQGWSASVALAAMKLLGLIASIAIAHHLCMRLMARRRAGAEGSIAVSSANLAFALLFVLGLGALSDALGFHFAIGAFFAAMMLTAELLGERSFERLENTCEVVTASLFGPLFLALQGMQFHLQALGELSFVATLVVGAVAAKLLGGYLVGRLQGLGSHDAWGVGIVMNARGVMELVVASIAYRADIIDASVYSALLLVGLVTTMITPLLLKRWQVVAPAVLGSTESRASR